MCRFTDHITEDEDRIGTVEETVDKVNALHAQLDDLRTTNRFGAAPETTKALIVTDGYISAIDVSNLSILINLTLLRLSSNSIAEIQEGAFSGFIDLKALVLDQNQISSPAISNNTFRKLQTLELLVLSNNALSSIDGAWFTPMKNLIRLQLNGNQLTNLTDNSFGSTSLYHLKNLDLSNNLISYIDKYTFLGLPQLQELDLARNNLKHISDAFFPLARLAVLNLDQNQWNCSCELQELSAFLRNFISSEKVLKNAKSMGCWNSQNPKVHNVLELSETNCLPATQTLTIIVKERSKNDYLRDLILVAVFCFAGAVGLTCLIIAILNGKLLLSKTEQQTSESCRCDHLNESGYALGQTNYLSKAYPDCHLTQENESKLMSIEGPRNNIPLMQHNSHRSAFQGGYESRVFDMALRNLEVEKEHSLPRGCFVCLNCGVVQSYLQGPHGRDLSPDEAGILSKQIQQDTAQRRGSKGEAQWDDTERKVLQKISRINQDINEDQLKRGSSKHREAFAGRGLEMHLTRKSYQSPSDTEEKRLAAYLLERQDDKEPLEASGGVASEEHAVQRAVHTRRSEAGDHTALLEQSRNASLEPESPLICKYIGCETIQNRKGQKKEIPMKNVTSGEAQTHPGNTEQNGFVTDGNGHAVHGASKSHGLKNVSFYIPDMIQSPDAEHGDVVAAKPSEKRLFIKDKKIHKIKLESNRVKKSERHSDAPQQSQQASMSRKGKLSKAMDSKIKIKTRRPDFLHVKINVHPFRKVRVHPGEPGKRVQACKQTKNGHHFQNHLDMAPIHKYKKDTKKKQKPELYSGNEKHVGRHADGQTFHSINSSKSQDNQVSIRKKSSKRKVQSSESQPDQKPEVRDNVGAIDAESRTEVDGPTTQTANQKPLTDGSEADAQRETTAPDVTSIPRPTGADVENEPLKSADTNPVKMATILMVLNIKKSNETINVSHGNNTDIQLDNNAQVQIDNAPNMQEVDSDQPGIVNSAQQAGELPLEGGEVLSALQEPKDISSEAENEALLIPSRANEAENAAPKPTRHTLTASPSGEKQSEENNSNNNQRAPSSPPPETPASSLGLSDQPKLMIVGEHASQPMDAKQYLTERNKQVETLQHTDASKANEPRVIHREGSQKRKISLVLPEQPNSRAQSINRKIK
ncbi:leucine-rich repeat-containing protein 53 [Ambystoma mexicanum]|uniref:leucine-rich repeat-containing protein 53 n=1 Tax=Ambystoma mexicanum TaxID=8296 RepID=UPI0037E7FA7F